MTFDAKINGEITNVLWYINMGPVNGQNHICGILPIEDFNLFCSLPSSDPANPEVLVLDYYFKLKS